MRYPDPPAVTTTLSGGAPQVTITIGGWSHTLPPGRTLDDERQRLREFYQSYKRCPAGMTSMPAYLLEQIAMLDGWTTASRAVGRYGRHRIVEVDLWVGTDYRERVRVRNLAEYDALMAARDAAPQEEPSDGV